MRLLSVGLVAVLSIAPLAAQDPHAQMKHRGETAMGFDQDKTAHHFLIYDDGGAIDISVNDAADIKNRDAIRSHLPHIATMFGSGDFDVPMLVHDSKAVPGTKTLAAKKTALTYTYKETPKGGRVDIVTNDADALAALHQFLAFQIAEHKTGDPTTPRKR